MANLVVGGAIATAIFIALGVVFALPPYIKGAQLAKEVPSILLTFSITTDEDMPQRCERITDMLEKNNLKAAVYFSGQIAEKYPECLKGFPDNIDIGSSTYTYGKLSAERDYVDQLEDVRRGNISSTTFKAPYEYTDDNIYSLLSRNDIFVDFSLSGSYNKYVDEKFILFELKTFDLSKHSVDEIESNVAKKVASKIQVVIDNSVSTEKVSLLIETLLQKQEATFVNASDLTGMNLTVRRK
jgi:peptidoglycan/xylan/chitin deacetylase (PgdA/CDA1 family)